MVPQQPQAPPNVNQWIATSTSNTTSKHLPSHAEHVLPGVDSLPLPADASPSLASQQSTIHRPTYTPDSAAGWDATRPKRGGTRRPDGDRVRPPGVRLGGPSPSSGALRCSFLRPSRPSPACRGGLPEDRTSDLTRSARLRGLDRNHHHSHRHSRSANSHIRHHTWHLHISGARKLPIKQRTQASVALTH